MSHSKTPYSPNFPSNQGYAPPPENDKAYPTNPYPHAAPVAPYPVSAAPPSHQSPMKMQMEPGFKPAYQPDFAPVPVGYHPPPPQTTFNPAFGHPQPPPVTHQPHPSAPGGWMTMPQGVPNCPPGLEYLSMIDQILVHQKVELLEAFTGFETKNKYEIKNTVGQKVYYAVEDTDCCTRMCCGPLRPFDMKIFDNLQNEVIHLNRPLACESCCFPCCLQRMEVSSPPGHIVGFVEQEWSLCKPLFLVKNAQGEVVLRIKGPLCQFSFCGDVNFSVLSKDGETKVGKITKQWSGLAREFFTDTDFFGITFPMDLDVKMKATLLGACFLIDFMYFEKTGQQGAS